MIEYIIKNKEWIFSGVGVSSLLLIGGWLLKRIIRWPQSEVKSVGSLPSMRVEVIHSQPQAASAIQPESEVEGIVKRFNQVLVLMNEKRTHGKYTIANLTQRMKLHSVGELESVFLGHREPDFKFMDNFCICFGVNSNWLIEGKGCPFSNSSGTYLDPMECLDEIINSKPERIYFIRCDSPVGETFILLKYADWQYKILSRIWHISDHVGAGGRSQIFDLYKLILALRNSQSRLSCGGRLLNENNFNRLFSGGIFPGAIIEFPNQENSWWDDFTDVHHTYPISSKYKSLYGKGFIEAQYIVCWELKRTEKYDEAAPENEIIDTVIPN